MSENAMERMMDDQQSQGTRPEETLSIDEPMSVPEASVAEGLLDSPIGFWGRYRAGRRGGFTLIELLIVLTVVLLLAGLLLGAVLVVRGRVRVAQQVAEITQLDLALSKFKEKYGIFPPSRIRLREWVQGPNDSAPSAGTAYQQNDPFDQHSVAYLRRIWPSIKLWIQSGGTNVETPGAGSIGQWFANNSGQGPVGPLVYELEGDECLVFFLGGVCEKISQGKYVLHGFTDDGTNPSRVPNPAISRTQTRVPSLYPFDVGRLYQRALETEPLVQADETARLAEFFAPTGSPPVYSEFFPMPVPLARIDNNGPRFGPGALPSYKIAGADQSRPLPVVYFSSYEGRGYRPDDVNIPSSSSVTATDNAQLFQLLWPQVSGLPSATPPTRPTPFSLGPNPYTRNTANPDPQVRQQPLGSRIQPYNPTTYQIILPGPDNEFGAGGAQADYDTTRGSPTGNWVPNDDNITNFSSGTPVGQFVTDQAPK